jgi:hypothetical protein
MYLRRKTRVSVTCEAIKYTTQALAKTHKFMQPMLVRTVAEWVLTSQDFAMLEIASRL